MVGLIDSGTFVPRLQQAASCAIDDTKPKHVSVTDTPEQMVRDANRHREMVITDLSTM